MYTVCPAPFGAFLIRNMRECIQVVASGLGLTLLDTGLYVQESFPAGYTGNHIRLGKQAENGQDRGY